jgi:hypothetical protein
VTLSFEVIDFKGSYHAILGRPWYAKFMAIPSYTYFKLKMAGPRNVITITGNFQDAYECERLAMEQAQQDLILDEPRLDVTEMLVEVLRGDVSSLACTAYLQTRLWDVPVLDGSLLLYTQ